MDTNTDAASSAGSPTPARVLGALVGACLGAACAVRTTGRPRADLVGASVLGPRTDRVGPMASLFIDRAVDDSWVATAVRAGLVARCDPMEDFVAGLPLAGLTRPEAAALATVAAAVSAAVDGCAPSVVVGLGVMAGDAASDAATEVPGPDLGVRLQWACALAARADEDPDEVIDLLVGTTDAVQECVPAAFAFLAAHTGEGADTPARDAADLCVGAAALGGASEVIATVVGALVGASRGIEAFPTDLVDDVDGSWPDLRSLAAGWATSRRS